ncbi:hypothetical protein CDD82_6015 [Ophiocordyceps australis]|uniref:DUF7721 domain-containing protein n=1 Tax=Ophiocordyceps australis TaxID=1399860 RepID=A0A2C5YWF2_9HYPO|nr:hypothetical protein CDD82_6015 [Ophiocordyceps australis]
MAFFCVCPLLISTPPPDAARKHKQTYQDGSGGDANSLGTAAALQALKKFTSDGGSGGGGKQSQSAFLGLAMSEASKLFDDKSAKGKVSSGVSKQDTIQKACEMALKFYLKSQGQQSGSAGLMSLASKFM